MRHPFFIAVLVVVAGGLIAAACFNPVAPEPGKPGLHCHELDNPACPSGQVCVSGRCMRLGGGTVLDGGSRDMAGGDMAGGPRDMTMNGGNRPQGCNVARMCWNACTNATCADGCMAMMDTAGQMLFDDALACGQQHCIDSLNCDISGTMLVDGPLGNCNGCLSNSLSGFIDMPCAGTTNCNPAQCVPKYNACKND
jgi:hypothetical protein